ncbi:MAG: sulfatase-like hydrolase/transferase [Pirellulaceae bacterium]|nr:sulfatase-like hydrolase/transferase [Pirellulaceae bacterium]
MSTRNAIVLVVDRLGTSCLGPYGNTWVETPGWNRLASQSLLCEQMLVDAPDLPSVYGAYWLGQHALSLPPGENRLPESPSWMDARILPSFLGRQGVRSLLLTDEPALVELPPARQFAEVRLMPTAGVERAAERIEQTELARGVSAALDCLDDQPDGRLVWIHLRGLAGPWDAPLELRNQFADEDDPLPGEFVVPPQKLLTPPWDPDETLRVSHAYAGQVAVLDACLDALLDALASSAWASSTLLAVTSARGCPLGEHGRIGPCDEALYAELLQVPCLLRHPEQARASWRIAPPVQPTDLHATLAGWFQLPAGTVPLWGRDLFSLHDARPDFQPRPACSRGPRQRSIRTPAWYLRVPEDAAPELFVKPDDRWEVNEVASRCPAIVEQMLVQLDQFARAAQLGQPDQLAPLPDELVRSEM